MRKTEYFYLKMEPDDRKKLDELAKDQDRSRSWIIRDAIRKRWYQAFGNLRMNVDK